MLLDEWHMTLLMYIGTEVFPFYLNQFRRSFATPYDNEFVCVIKGFIIWIQKIVCKP